MNNPYFKQTWWDTTIKEKESGFLYGIGKSDAISKIFSRQYVKSKGYRSIIDLGCGPATEFFAYKDEGYEINYLGIDSSQYLFKINLERGVPMLLSRAESVHLPQNSYEIVYSRHVLEHQPFFEPILEEMIRLAEKEATHVFFFKPGENPKFSHFNEEENLWHSTYNKKEIENFLEQHPKVDFFFWEDVPLPENGLADGFTPEVMLHIIMKKAKLDHEIICNEPKRFTIENEITGKKITFFLDPGDILKLESFNF
jgi:SAM-dependent methyltransferase